MCYSVPGGDLWLAKALSLFLHPPPPRHHDRQPSLDHLDLKGHELHRGEHFSVFYCVLSLIICIIPQTGLIVEERCSVTPLVLH